MISKIYTVLLLTFTYLLTSHGNSTEIPTSTSFTTTSEVNQENLNTTTSYIKELLSTEENLETTTATILTTKCSLNGTNCGGFVNNTTDVFSNNTKILPHDFIPDIPNFMPKYDRVDVKSCSCNLLDKICDINCCCDTDCTFENKLVFTSCLDAKDRYVDTKFCKFSEYIYKNNTPFLWEINQNGLFCIVRSNLPKEYLLQKKKSIKDIEEAKLQLKKKYSWRDSSKEIKIETGQGNFLKYGDNLWILNNNSTFSKFGIPNAFVTSVCKTQETIKYLVDTHTACSHSNVDENNSFLQMDSFIKDIFFFFGSNPANFSSKIVNRKNCPNFICIPPQPKLCNTHLKNCKNLTKTVKATCTVSISKYEKTCVNLPEKVLYNIHHNGTNGIIKVEIFIALANFTHSLKETNPQFEQQFFVKFYWTNGTFNYNNISLIHSGSPGYLIGKPILLAKLHINETFINNTVTNKTEILVTRNMKRNFSDVQENFIILHKSQNGICVLNEDVYNSVDFGFNMILKCNIDEKIKIILKLDRIDIKDKINETKTKIKFLNTKEDPGKIEVSMKNEVKEILSKTDGIKKKLKKEAIINSNEVKLNSNEVKLNSSKVELKSNEVKLNSNITKFNSNDTKYISASDICKEIQTKILHFWSIRLENSTVKVTGNFGNANISKIEDWSEILYEIEPQNLLNMTRGLFHDNSSLICYNISNSLRISVFHSRVTFEDLLNQEKIIRTVFSFQNLIETKFDFENDNVHIKLPIRSEVMFYDITSQIIRKFADPPTFEIKLPYDFFYPFIKVRNSGLDLKSDALQYMFCIYFLFVLNA